MYYLLILAVVFERLAELVVAQRNARWSFAQGGKEFGRPHYVVMVSCTPPYCWAASSNRGPCTGLSYRGSAGRCWP